MKPVRTRTAHSIIVALATLSSFAQAEPVDIPNHSFESGNSSWNQNSGGIKTPPSGDDNIGPATDGTKVYFTWGPGQNISQVLTEETLEAKTTYTLKMDLITRTDSEGLIKAYLTLGYGENGPGGAGSVEMKSISSNEPGAPTPTPGTGGFTTWALTVDSDDFPDGVGEELWIQLGVKPETRNTGSVAYDNIRLDALFSSGSDFDTWATSQGVLPGSQSVDSDDGGKNNLYEFGLGGDPTDSSDDFGLLHVFSADVAGEDGLPEGVLTFLVRNGATFGAVGNNQRSLAIGDIVYTVAGENTLPVASGAKVRKSETVVDTGLPPAPAGYQYVSFYLTDDEGYFRVTVEPALEGGEGDAFDLWAASHGVPPGSQAIDSDNGGKDNLYEFGLGGNPASRNDDGALQHFYLADVAGGDGIPEGVLTVLVRSGVVFGPSGNDQQSSVIDGMIYTIAADTTLPVASGLSVNLSGTVVNSGLPAAPAGYEYVSFYVSGPGGYYKVTVDPAF